MDSTTVAPGGTGSVSITPDSQGLLRVLVDVHRESDEGRLEVKPVTAAEDIQGDTTWTYAVG
ncbi:MAG: hypothetical protein GTO22_18960 [Gemmatimonadales bacterium]|nr:hypothetical protein [Gemmatimonadales bacterium]